MVICPRSCCYTVFLAAFFAYTGFVYTVGTRQPDGIAQASPLALRGRDVFQNNNCYACHQLYGLGGHMGPDLTNVMSHPAKGEPYVRAIVPSGMGGMPRFKLSEAELDALVSYLSYVDSTGESPTRNYEVTPWGSIRLGSRKLDS